MKCRRTIRQLLAWALILPAWAAHGSSDDELQFEVLLDNTPIGTHSFRITEAPAGRTVQIDAEFDVKVLFVPVYKYRHTNTEVWQNGCLAKLTSQTDANGERYAVEGERNGQGFDVSADVPSQSTRESYAIDCLMSFAYWDRAMLEQRQLLNGQTGEVIDVEIEPLGEATLAFGDANVVADGYHIVAEPQDVDIKVWYDKPSGRWVSLESRLKSGRVMRYIPAERDQLALRETSDVTRSR